MSVDGEEPEALAVSCILPAREVEADTSTEVDVAVDVGTYEGRSSRRMSLPKPVIPSSA